MSLQRSIPSESGQRSNREKRSRYCKEASRELLSRDGSPNLNQLEQLAVSTLGSSRFLQRKKCEDNNAFCEPSKPAVTPPWGVYSGQGNRKNPANQKCPRKGKVRSLKEIMSLSEKPSAALYCGSPQAENPLSMHVHDAQNITKEYSRMATTSTNERDPLLAHSSESSREVQSEHTEYNDHSGAPKTCAPDSGPHYAKPLHCPIIKGLLQEGLVQVGERVEYRSPQNRCLAVGCITECGIICGSCGNSVTCPDFGRCAGKICSSVGKEIYLESGERVDDLLLKVLGQEYGAYSKPMAAVPNNAVKPNRGRQQADLDYDKTVDILLGVI